MNNQVYKTKSGAMLYRLGYRLDKKTHWRLTIDSFGLDLTPAEQDINRKGGRDFGKDSELILSREISETRNFLKDYAEDEIENSRELRFRHEWLKDAEK